MAIKIILADDHYIVREGLRSLLSQFPGIEIIGEADDGEQTLALVRQLQPDVAVVDISMPGLNGLEAVREVVGSGLPTRVLILTMHETEQYAVEALSLGASGYIIKRSTAEELAKAIRAVYRGETYVCPSVAGKLLQHYCQARSSGSSEPQQAGPKNDLTHRQKQILQLIAQGKTNREISEILCISLRTVQTHRAKLMERLNLHSTADLTRYAIREGLVQA